MGGVRERERERNTSLFAKGAFCSERFWIMPYQAATILTRALEKTGVEGLTLCMRAL